MFWIKGQPYSLIDLLHNDPLTSEFVGGTLYQAFLSALSYHRWNSPVSGTVVKAYNLYGSYYSETLPQGFENHNGPDPAAPNDSQAYITETASRAVIFIKADNPKIGLMCFVAVGMAEVSGTKLLLKLVSILIKVINLVFSTLVAQLMFFRLDQELMFNLIFMVKSQV